ncbi:SRPBCC family protein [Paracoccus onubensis]|uniref:SRPBCC family protein n=1 Tax=Paracoccus onubensis TaxID=1675788 RepID=UPI0027321F9C|nr:SRPBCC family protein [Paracoccus onubensis]MDP0930190.1 SRPBCC family protein [Paracoccus onubensis]
MVTFANGVIVREPIITLDDVARRLVWSVEGLRFTHYNAAVQVFERSTSTSIVWTADFRPDDAAAEQDAAMEAGMQAMKKTLDQLEDDE